MILRALAPLGLVLLGSSHALAQQYVVSVAETGPMPTAYEKRNNWRYYGDYRHTTMVASSTNPLACQESPCLDDGEPGDKGPDLTRGGTATATVPGMQPGKYRLELRYNQTVNRSTSVPWQVTSDAASNNSLSGKLDQKNTTPGSSNWLVLGKSDESPFDVQSQVTFVFGSASVTFNGSLSYGGIRLVKTAGLPPPIEDAGATDATEPDADDASTTEAGAVDAASGDAGVADATLDAVSDTGGTTEASDAGCGCVVGAKRGGPPPAFPTWLGLALAGWTFRRLRRAQRSLDKSASGDTSESCSKAQRPGSQWFSPTDRYFE